MANESRKLARVGIVCETSLELEALGALLDAPPPAAAAAGETTGGRV
ncbi:MAG TPA: hypothetical protein VER76_03900 [Pyrinomonadaceae bacterium]|nr:hypothetical protein [Pyrinomonadaceae bacterium]